MADLQYCPSCGKQTFRKDSEKSYRCSDCDFLLFINTATAVALILEFDNHLLFTVRASEPKKGRLDLPGGFADHNESAEQALNRELQEELGLTGVKPTYLTSFPNQYPYAGYLYHTLDLFYYLKLNNKPDVTANDDVADILWIEKNNIPMDNIAFKSVTNALKFYLKDH